MKTKTQNKIYNQFIQKLNNNNGRITKNAIKFVASKNLLPVLISSRFAEVESVADGLLREGYQISRRELEKLNIAKGN